MELLCFQFKNWAESFSAKISNNNDIGPRFLIGQYVTVHGEVVSHVNISRVEVEDGGLYSCIVDNRAGTAKHEGRLNIYGESRPEVTPRVESCDLELYIMIALY
jgi:hypothetical protein